MFQPYLLELAGKPAGRFFEARGGGIIELVGTTLGYEPIQRKPLGYNDIVLTCGTGMSRLFYDWVGSAFSRNARRMDAAVIALDHSSKPIRRQEVRSAFVTSLVLPELNKSPSKEAVLMVTLKPTLAPLDKSGQNQSLGAYASSVSKTWRTSDFRLRITGLETACLQVTGIQALKLGEKIVEDKIPGESRDKEFEPGKAEFSNVALEVPKAHAGPFFDWSRNSVLKGNSSSEKEGSLDFLAPGSATPYFTVKLNGLGISYMASASRNTGSVEVRMYCEEMIFSAGAAAIH